MDAQKLEDPQIIKIVENVEPGGRRRQFGENRFGVFYKKNNFGDILETDLEIVCVSCLGKSDITAGRPLVDYL